MSLIYPATTYPQAVDLTISEANILHQVIQGDNATDVTVDVGEPIPTLRKTLKYIEDTGTGQLKYQERSLNFPAQVFTNYFVDLSNVSVAVTLPDNAEDGQWVHLYDANGYASTNNLLVGTNDGSTIEGSANLTISEDYLFTLFYRSGTDWKTFSVSKPQQLDLKYTRQFKSVEKMLEAAEAGQVAVGQTVETLSYIEGQGKGANRYTLQNAGSSGSRPSEDLGSVFYVSGGSGGLWLEGLFLDGVVRPEQFGAIDSTASQEVQIQLAIDYEAINGLTLDWGSAPKKWLTTYPIEVRSNSNWVGTAELINTNNAGDINSSTLLPGGFNPVYFGPTNPEVDQYTYYPLNSVTESRIVTLTNALDADNFTENVLVWILTTDTWRGASGDYPLFAQLAIVESSDNSSGEIVLDSAISEDINSKYGAAQICLAEDSSVIDLLGNPLKFCIGAKIDGLSVTSLTGNILARGGMYNCDFNFSRMKGKNIVFANAFCRTKVSVNSTIATRKLVDVAGFSHDFDITINSNSYTFDSTQSEGVEYMRVGECSRDGEVSCNSVNANGFIYSNALGQIDSGCHRVSINSPRTVCDGHSGTPFKFNVATVAAGVQPKLEKCKMLVDGRFGGSLDRIGWMDTGDNNDMLDCGFDFIGANLDGAASLSTGYAVELAGVRSFVSDAKCNEGSVRIPTDVKNTYVRGYFADGASVIERENDVLISSLSGQAALVGNVRSTNVQNITATNPDNPVLTTLFPSNSLAAGDRWLLKATGEIVGTSDAKTIKFIDDNTTFFAFSIPSGTQGNFTLECSIIVQNATRYTAVGILNILGDDTLSDSVDSLEDLSQNTTFELQAWVDNAADNIRFHSLDATIKKEYHPSNGLS